MSQKIINKKPENEVAEEKKLQEIIEKQLRNVFTNGMRQGSKAILGVVLDEVNATDKTPDQKLETIKTFCENSLKVQVEKE